MTPVDLSRRARDSAAGGEPPAPTTTAGVRSASSGAQLAAPSVAAVSSRSGSQPSASVAPGRVEMSVMGVLSFAGYDRAGTPSEGSGRRDRPRMPSPRRGLTHSAPPGL